MRVNLFEFLSCLRLNTFDLIPPLLQWCDYNLFKCFDFCTLDVHNVFILTQVTGHLGASPGVLEAPFHRCQIRFRISATRPRFVFFQYFFYLARHAYEHCAYYEACIARVLNVYRTR